MGKRFSHKYAHHVPAANVPIYLSIAGMALRAEPSGSVRSGHCMAQDQPVFPYCTMQVEMPR
jgi:hypothetical protein